MFSFGFWGGCVESKMFACSNLDHYAERLKSKCHHDLPLGVCHTQSSLLCEPLSAVSFSTAAEIGLGLA